MSDPTLLWVIVRNGVDVGVGAPDVPVAGRFFEDQAKAWVEDEVLRYVQVQAHLNKGLVPALLKNIPLLEECIGIWKAAADKGLVSAGFAVHDGGDRDPEAEYYDPPADANDWLVRYQLMMPHGIDAAFYTKLAGLIQPAMFTIHPVPVE